MSSPLPRNWMVSFFRGEDPPWPVTPAFLHEVIECARSERAHGLLAEQLEARKLPAALGRELAVFRHRAIALEMLRQEEVQRVVAALAAAGLHFLLFKGTALAYSLYPEPCLRDRGDTDLLFESRDTAEQAWRVLQDLGYERMNTVDGELVSYQFPCVLRGGQLPAMLDIHWATSNTAGLRQLAFPELWQQSIAVPALGPAARAPCHVHALVLACLHRLGHASEGHENKLIWLYDIFLLLQSLDDNQWQGFIACARDRGAIGVCRDGAEQALASFGTGGRRELRLAELRRLQHLPGQQFEVHGSILQRDLAQLRDAAGLRQRLQLLVEHLFPPSSYMQAKYHPRWRWLLPFYYVRRIVQGVSRRLAGHLVGNR